MLLGLAWMDERVRRYLDRLDAARARPLAEQLEDDLAPLRGISIEDRARLVKSVCAAARKLIDARADRERILGHQDPLPAESEARWLRLVRQTARSRKAHGRG